MGCKMPWWAGSETPPPDKDKMIADLRAEVASLKEKYEIALNRIANFEDMRDEYKQQLASLKEEQRKDSEDMLRLIADIRYVAGIAERGRGKPLGDGEKFTQAVLDYVKSLESQQRDLTQQLAAANGRLERMREALEKVNRSYLESTHSDDHGYVEIFTDATHAAVEAALSDLPEADKEKSE